MLSLKMQDIKFDFISIYNKKNLYFAYNIFQNS